MTAISDLFMVMLIFIMNIKSNKSRPQNKITFIVHIKHDVGSCTSGKFFLIVKCSLDKLFLTKYSVVQVSFNVLESVSLLLSTKFQGVKVT